MSFDKKSIKFLQSEHDYETLFGSKAEFQHYKYYRILQSDIKDIWLQWVFMLICFAWLILIDQSIAVW